jgi:tRNA-specific 2-thiouridylase
MDKRNVHVYVGMSGGVDSSVTAALLKKQGYRVTGVYMKNWTTDLPGFTCPWADDLADAKRVAVQLDIPFKVFDFQKEYKQQVVDYMIAEYKAGRTPNPDVMCNQEIKFDLFLRAALADGADMIATGHYARIARTFVEQPTEKEPAPQPSAVRSFFLSSESTPAGKSGAAPRRATRHQDPELFDQGQSNSPGKGLHLLAGLDKNKDQSYFLYRVTAEALSKTLLPIGELTKPEVREEARKLGLATAEKKDSQGICFVGKIGIKEFLQNYVNAEPGDIIDKKTGTVVGQHDGAIFYTIGQRQGLHVGGGLPFYVVDKNMAKNLVYVTTDLNDERLWRNKLELAQLHWINDAPEPGRTYQVRTRYRASLIDCDIKIEGDRARVAMEDPERALTAGQSAVIYSGDSVIGGGIVV